jgi:hypothetical protein
VLLIQPIDAAQRMQARAGQHIYTMAGMERRRFARGTRQRARNRSDYKIVRRRLILRRIGVVNSQYVARILYQSILATASSSRERHLTRARKLDSVEHAVETLVRAGGRGPQRVEPVQDFIAPVAIERGRRNPSDVNIDAEPLRRFLRSRLHGDVGDEARIEIANDADFDGRHSISVANATPATTR